MNGIRIKNRNCKRNAAVAETALLGFLALCLSQLWLQKCRFLKIWVILAERAHGSFFVK